MSDEFCQDMLGEFLDESEELLTSLNDNLLKLDDWVHELAEDESKRCDDELMNEMFRSAHSFKGLSAMMGLTDINGLTHKVENVFDAARNDQLNLTPEIVELVFQAADRLGQMVEALKDPNHPPIESEDVIASIATTLKAAGVDKEQGSQSDIEHTFDGTGPSAEETVDPTADEPGQNDEAVSSTETEAVTADDDPFAGIEDDFSAPAEYIEIFIDETTSALDRLADILSDAIEPLAGAHVDELLVATHRVKGGAASVGMQHAAKLAHYIEDILQELRNDHKPVVPVVAESMLACIDGLRAYVDGLKNQESNSDNFGQLLAGLRSSYAQASSDSEADGESEADGQDVPVADAPPSAAEENEWSAEARETILAAAPAGTSGIIGRVQLEAGQPLPGLKGCLIYERVSQSGETFHLDPEQSTIADLEELTSLTFGVCTEDGVDALRKAIDVSGVSRIELQEFGEARDQAEEAIGASANESATEPEPPATATNSDVAATNNEPAATNSDVAADSAPVAPTPSPSTAETSKTVTTSKSAEDSASPADRNKPAETIRVDIDRLDHLMNLAGQLVINKARFAQIADSLKYLAARKQSAHSVDEIFGTLRKLDAAVAEPHSGSHLDTDTIRSHVRRMQAGLETVQRDVGQLTEARARVSDLLEAVHQLDRVSDSMQKSVMDTRMVPVGPLFNRFKRVIRDISRNNGKDIRLKVHGEKTELDKRMIDELGDPLVHMIRNSADHGIESPEEREAAGKPRQGTVNLNAYHSGNSIVVQVKDDGAGIDAEKLLAKAIEKGVVSRADAEKLSPQQIYQLIWEPGFSTAKKVTDVSGRGMGMDIVRSAIEDLNGQVDTDSVPGEGTTFTVKLPLTLAILPSLLSKVGDNVFAMPIETVVEIVSVPNDGFSTVQGKRTATVRGRVVSIVDLFETFRWQMSEQTSANRTETTLVIVRAEGRELALIVDELLGEEDIVIKSISENYRNVLGIAGASILGDGRVSLILDVPTIIELAASPAQQLTV